MFSSDSTHIITSFHEIQPSSVNDLIQLASEVMNGKWNENILHWKYFQNPTGQINGMYAEFEGHAVGSYGNIPVKIKFINDTITCAQAVDAMIDPKFRRLGLFTRLARKTYTWMDQAGIALTYAFPNPVTKAGFVKRLDWTPVGRVPRYIKILDLDGLLEVSAHKGLKAAVYRRLLGQTKSGYRRTGSSNVMISRVNAFDIRVDRLWEQISPDLGIAVQRDLTYLNWRYVQNPKKLYQILIAEREAELVGYIVLSSRDLDNRKASSIAEFMVLPGNQATGSALLEEATIHAKETGCATIECWMLPQHTFYTSLLKDSGYIYSNKGYMPGLVKYTTPFIIRPHPGLQLSPDPRDIENWFLTMGDHDYY